MKAIKLLIFVSLLLAFTCSSPFAATNWDKDKPSGSTKIRLSDELIRANWSALEDAIGRNHNFPGNESTDAGEHTVVELQDQSGDATIPASIIGIYNDGDVLKGRLASDGRIIRLETEHIILSKSAAYTAVLADFSKLLSVTGTTTITLTAAATLGDGWHIFIKNNGSAIVTIDGNAAETIDGNLTITLPGEDDVIGITCDGSNFHMIALRTSQPAITFENSNHTHRDIANGGTITGMVVQVVNTQSGAVATGSTVIPQDDTIPQNDEGDEFLTLAITPTDASNELYIEVNVCYSVDGARQVAIALFQDSTVNALAVVADVNSATNDLVTTSLLFKMVAGTTSATTFKIRIGANGGTLTFNGQGSGRLFGGKYSSTIKITEIQI